MGGMAEHTQLIDAINIRTAVRAYDDEPIDDDTARQLEMALQPINLLGDLNIQLVRDQPKVFAEANASGHLTNAANYLAIVGPANDEEAKERAGFYAERMVLTATLRGLGTLWVAGSWDKAEAAKLGDSPEAQSLADKAEDIRRQSAGALDEAHSIIDMLRNPHQAWEQLAPSDDTSLTRESLDALIADTRNSGTSLNTWIDIQQLSVMDESIGKVAYRAIQEGLTNARRHAPGAPVSLEVSATPQAGVHIHISNPIATDATETQRAHGAGLPGLAARVHSVNGQCRYGMDDRHLFHVDVQLPWRS